ncbi:MAG: hypothetical protein IKT32_06710, partial [Clostridia bacterium]|nr:hypothetical protein [Clostridia bacterium]
MAYKYNMNSTVKKKKENYSVYFVGICGASMSGLALYLKNKGFKVSGYDKNSASKEEFFLNRGIPINRECDLVECDIAVVSSAISENDERMVKLRAYNKTIISRAELLKQISLGYNIRIGVAGTHGKTTCTAMLVHILKCANERFCAHIGGMDCEYGNIVDCGESIFLSEVCEYKRNISLFSPTVAVLLNIANDHIESYSSFNNLVQEFTSYINRANTAVVEYSYKHLAKNNCLTFSLNNSKADFYATDIKERVNGVECVVNGAIGALFALKLNSFFVHDIQNALACVAVATSLGIENEIIKRGIESFKGVKRRNEIMCKSEGFVVYADYAHHPEQVEKTIKAIQRAYGKCAVFFQSHTYSRTANLFKDFIKVLSLADNLFIFDTYPARESYDYKG